MVRFRKAVCLIALALVAAGCGGNSGTESSSNSESTVEESSADSTAEEPATEETEEQATEAPATTAAPAVPLSRLLPDIDNLGPRAAAEIPTALPEPMCPGWNQLDGLSFVDTATRTFAGDPVQGPFMTIGIFEFGDGQAEAYLDAHIEGAAGPCGQYETVNAQGGPLSLGWSSVGGTELGDRSINLEVRGETAGVSVNSDVVLIRVGDRVGYVGYLTYGFPPDARTRDAAVAGVMQALEGENIGSIETGGSAADIAAVLPGLEELANPALVAERNTAALPNSQCPDNLSTLSDLTLEAGEAREFLGHKDFGPFVTVSILELGPGEADRFIDRWAAGAEGPCAAYIASGLDYGWSIGSGPEHLDRTVTLFGRGTQMALGVPASGDYVLIRSGDFVGYIHYFIVDEPQPDVASRDTMVDALVAALEELSA